MKITYAKDVDVLYITLHNEPAHHATDTDGVVLRYREDGTLIGITLIGITDILDHFQS